MTDSDSRKSERSAEELYQEFITSTRSGEEADLEEFIANHPSVEARLRELFGQAGGEEIDLLDEGSEKRELGGMPEMLGDFRIVRRLGAGAMGVVYEAEQISLQRRVALKVLDQQRSISDRAVLKFHREAEAGARQRHQGIVAVHAVGEQDGIHYIAQELVEGGYDLQDSLNDVEQKVEKRGSKARDYFRETAELTAEIAEALHHAHENGVIHRDVKPSNILVTEQGRPKVTDFGLARVEGALSLTTTGEFSGTVYYMSPEQAASSRIGIDHRTDIFSLGVTLYQMLTFELPFPGDTQQEVLHKILLAEPRDPCRIDARVPRDLAVICLKALEKKPDRRYASMEAFSKDLRRFLEGADIEARPPGATRKLAGLARRHPALSAACAATVVTAVVLIVLFSMMQKVFIPPGDRIEKERLSAAKGESVAVQALILEELKKTFEGTDMGWLEQSNVFGGIDDDLSMDILRRSDEGDYRELGPFEVLRPGDRGRLRIRNQTERFFDIGVFQIKSDRSIEAIFPQGPNDSPRVGPGFEHEFTDYFIDDHSLGIEHLLTIAIPRDPDSPEINLCWLAGHPALVPVESEDHFGSKLFVFKLGAPDRGMSIVPRSEDNPGLRLFTWRTEWPLPLPPASWLDGKPEPVRDRKGTGKDSGTSSEIKCPNPWQIGPNAALARSCAGLTAPDLLLAGDDRPSQVFIDLDGTIGVVDRGAGFFPMGFDAEVAFHFGEEGTRTAFYDTDNNGDFDLIFVARGGADRADTYFIQDEKGKWQHIHGIDVPWLSSRYLAFLETTDAVKSTIDKFKVLAAEPENSDAQ